MEVMNKKNFFLMLICIMLIFLSSGSYVQSLGRVENIFIILLDIGCFFTVLYDGILLKKNIKYFATAIFFIMFVQTFIIVEDTKAVLIYFKFFSLIIIAHVISEKVSIQNIAKCLVMFMEIVTSISLIGYYFVNYTNLTKFWPEIINVNDIVYKGIGIFTYIKIIPKRNCAVFWEPGLFATYLIWALLANILILKVSKERYFFRFILFSLGIYSTHSTAGYILWLMVIILVMVLFFSKKSEKKLFMVFSFFLISSIFCILNLDFLLNILNLDNDPLWMKLTKENFFSELRVLSLRHNIGYFLKNFFVGQGIKRAYLSADYVCDTSTSTFMLNIFGWMGSFYTIFWVYGIFKQKKINIYSKIIVFFIILSVLNKEPHIRILFSWIILYSLLNDSIDKKNKKVKLSEIFKKSKKYFRKG